MVISAEQKSYLLPFTCNGDFDEWVKIFPVGRKPQNKQVKNI